MEMAYPVCEQVALVFDEDLSKKYLRNRNDNAQVDFESIAATCLDIEADFAESKLHINNLSEFEGEIEQVYEDVPERRLSDFMDENTVFYFPAQRQADLFSKAYDNVDEVVEEFLEALGHRLTRDDILPNVVSINGTYFS